MFNEREWGGGKVGGRGRGGAGEWGLNWRIQDRGEQDWVRPYFFLQAS